MPATATKAEKSAKNGKAPARASAPASPPPIDAKVVRRTVDALKNASDATRLTVLLTLADRERFVGDLCGDVGSAQPNLSHHLRLLRAGGLVESSRRGKNVAYSLSDKGRSMVRFLSDFLV